jgi:hypothetical protein
LLQIFTFQLVLMLGFGKEGGNVKSHRAILGAYG